ncbi:MAG: hypothetical protein R3B47_09445 [Bacteroidia bacterium]
MYITAFQSNGKDIDNLRIATDDGPLWRTLGAGYNYRLSLQPYQNEEATDITLSAKALYLVTVNAGLNRFVYNIGELTIPRNEVLDQPAGDEIVNDIVTTGFSSVQVDFRSLNGQNINDWVAGITVSGDDFSHDLNIQANDFTRGNLVFPVQPSGEVVVKVVGQKGGDAFSLEKKVSMPGFGTNNAKLVFEL